MSFTRVNPSGWAVGDLFTSAQANQLDSNVSNSLDKSSAGDTLKGPVIILSGGAVISNVIAGVQGVVAQAIFTGVPGALTLGGGATDWPAFSPVRTRSIWSHPRPLYQLGSGWSLAGSVLVGPASNINGQALAFPQLHNGATVSTVSVQFAVTNLHSSVPAILPSLSVFQVNAATGALATLSGTDPQFFTPGPATGAAWSVGTLKTLTYTCNQNRVIDTSTYIYYIVLTDENGSGSIPGNFYQALNVSYSAIADMRFP